MKKQKYSSIAMLVTAFFWGTTFVAQRAAAQYLGTFTWVSVRAFLAVLMLLPCIKLMRKLGFSERTKNPKDLLKAGLCCGVVLFFSTSSQQLGMHYTSAGKAGFLTALYIIIVPIFRMIGGKRVSLSIWLCVLVATVGMYLMSVTEQFTIAVGDLILVGCALFFSAHILVVDHFSDHVEALALCALQFVVSGLLALPCAFIFETPTMEGITRAAIPLLYAALFSGCIAYSCQIIGQQNLEPTRASLIMCLESVFALVSGWAVLGERLTIREGIGTALIFLAIVGSTLLTREKAPIRVASEPEPAAEHKAA